MRQGGTIITDPSLLRLLQLSSSTLPVGGYSFSQGLEYAVEAGWVTNLAATEDWLLLQLRHSLAQVDFPIALRLHRALQSGDNQAFVYWTHYLLACRETAELNLTETAMGDALARLIRELKLPLPGHIVELPPTFTGLFVWVGHHWGLDARACQIGLFWSWLEAQVAAAVKLVPLGQSDAQRLLGVMQEPISEMLDFAAQLPDESVGSSLPGLAMSSVRHEQQYCRLFRS